MSTTDLRARLLLQIASAPEPVAATDIASWLAAGDIACAILSARGEPDRDTLRTTVQNLQQAGIAVMLCDDITLAGDTGADGVHLTNTEHLLSDYEKARESLTDNAIVGIVSCPDRHTAMVLAEQGADYVAFDLASQRDDALWWAEVVEVPCVVIGTDTSEEAVIMAEKGVEFIAVPTDVAAIRMVENAVQNVPLVSA